MEILHEINPALEALAYLGSRANGHTLDRLEERLQARGVRKACIRRTATANGAKFGSILKTAQRRS